MKRIILCSALFLSLYACKNKTEAVQADNKKEAPANSSKQENTNTTSPTIKSSDASSSPETGTTGTWVKLRKLLL